MTEPGAENSPVGGYGAILQPKKFVPDEAQQTSSLFDTDLDGIDDTIDLDQPPELRQKVKEGKRSKKQSTRHKDRYGEKEPSGAVLAKKFKEAKRALIELESAVDKMDIDDGSGKYYWGSVVGNLLTQLVKAQKSISKTVTMDEEAVDEEYKSKAQQGYFHAKAAEGDPEFKKLAAEFDDDTTEAEFENLPARAPKREALNSESIKRLVKEEIIRQIRQERKKDD